MSEHFDRVEEARERNEGLAYEEYVERVQALADAVEEDVDAMVDAWFYPAEEREENEDDEE